MIFDTLDNLVNYADIEPKLNDVIQYLENLDSGNLVEGKNEIQGDDLFLVLQNNILNAEPTETYEYHKKYIDLHIPVEGEEAMVYGYGNNKEIKEYDSEDDYGLINCDLKQIFEVTENTFCLFLPDEAHEPNIKTSRCEKIKKYVIKIAV